MKDCKGNQNPDSTLEDIVEDCGHNVGWFAKTKKPKKSKPRNLFSDNCKNIPGVARFVLHRGF